MKGQFAQDKIRPPTHVNLICNMVDSRSGAIVDTYPGCIHIQRLIGPDLYRIIIGAKTFNYKSPTTAWLKWQAAHIGDAGQGRPGPTRHIQRRISRMRDIQACRSLRQTHGAVTRTPNRASIHRDRCRPPRRRCKPPSPDHLQTCHRESRASTW